MTHLTGICRIWLKLAFMAAINTYLRMRVKHLQILLAFLSAVLPTTCLQLSLI